MSAPVIEVYAKKGCGLCKKVKKTIDKVQNDIPFNFKEIEISKSPDLLRRYNEHVPTIFINGKKAFKFKLDETEFRKRVRKEIIKAGLSRVNVKQELILK
jgi:glutaredoxin